MCGIFGIINASDTRPDPDLLRRATRMLQHRGPDGEGYFSEGPIGLGHRRLAIIDLSPKGIQPMQGFGSTITYNGEIYNYLELRKILEKESFQFTTQTDTEVVLAAYAHWGQDCVHHFRGMWAFAIYDPEKQEVFCSRDRFGIKPFYYTSINNNFYFASEIKAFTALPDWAPELNPKYAGQLLLAGQQHQGADTIFENVSQLLPGHHLVYQLQEKKFHVSTYYSLDNIEHQNISSQEAADQFRDLFDQSVQLHLRSDVTVGTAFSGGLDSSCILAKVYESFSGTKGNIEAVSYCSQTKGFDESPYIDIFAEKYPINIHRISPDFSQLLQHLDQAIIAQDEPILSGSLLAQYAVFKEAQAKGLKVMLDGQGADELLAGYGTYYPPYFKYLLKNKPFKLPLEAIQLLRHHQIPWNKILGVFQNKPPVKGINLRLSDTSSSSDSFASYTKEMIRTKHLPGLLHYEDRNSMAHSVEGRVPFLDHQLVEFCLSLPPDLHIRKGIRKQVLRDALGELLPQKIAKRYDKMGFVTPQELWMEQQANFVLKLVKETQITFPEIFNKNWMLWAGIVLSKKQRLHYPLLWRAISFGKWGRLYLGRS